MKITSGRPSATKKTLSIDDMEDDTVGMLIHVSKDTHKRIKQFSLDKERRIKDIIRELIEREFK